MSKTPLQINRVRNTCVEHYSCSSFGTDSFHKIDKLWTKTEKPVHFLHVSMEHAIKRKWSTLSNEKNTIRTSVADQDPGSGMIDQDHISQGLETSDPDP